MGYWAYEADHEARAIGNQDLVEEADILGTGESIQRCDGHVGVLGDLAQEHPAVVIEYADQVGTRLADNNIQTWVNASIALQRAGEEGSAAIRAQQDRLEAPLHGPSPEVRTSVCTPIGNTNVSVPIEDVEDVKENDQDETVHECPAWAISQLEWDGGGARLSGISVEWGT